SQPGLLCPDQSTRAAPTELLVAFAPTYRRIEIGVQTAARRTDRSTFGFIPADFAKGRLRLSVRHPQHVREAERLCLGGEEKVLRQGLVPGFLFSNIRTSGGFASKKLSYTILFA